MVVCVKMMSKGSKEALAVLIVTHVTVLMSKGSKVFVAYVHNIDTFNAMSKGLKKALTVLIVTHVTHVERVKSVCGLCTQYRYSQCYVKRVERVERLCYVETRDKHIFAHNFLNIQAIFNPKKVLESRELDLSNRTNVIYVEGVESYFDFRPLLHALIYIALDGMVGKV